MASRIYISTIEAKYFETNKLEIAHRIPTIGKYKEGDLVISNTQGGNLIGWVCVKEGEPGQWKEINNMDSSIIYRIEILEDELEKIIIKLNGFDDEVILLKERISNIENSINDNVEHINKLDMDLSELEKRVDDHKGYINSVEEKNVEQDTRLNTLEDIVDEHDELLDSLGKDVNKNTSDIDRLEGIINNNNGNVILDLDSIEKRVVKNEQDIKELQNKDVEYDARLDDLDERVIKNRKDIDELFSALKSILDDMDINYDHNAKWKDLIWLIITGKTIPCTEIALDKSTIEMIAGSQYILNATLTPVNTTDSIIWTSSNNDIATVSKGIVTGKATGSCVINVTCGNKFATCMVTVNSSNVNCTTINLDRTTMSMNVGDQCVLLATVLPKNTTDTISWHSNNSDVASVDQSGLVLAKKAGKSCTITAKCGEQYAYCTVTVKEEEIACTDLTLDKSELTLNVGNQYTLTATVIPEDTTDYIIWKSSSAAIATVRNGLVTAVSSGTAIITSTCGDKTTTCNVTVKPAVISCTEITLNKSTLIMEIDQTDTLVTTISPSNTTDIVKWSSTNSNIVAVDGNGNILAKSAGTVTITATCGNKYAHCTVTVKEEAIRCEGLYFLMDNLTLTLGESINIPDILICEPSTMFNDVVWRYTTIVSVDKSRNVIIANSIGVTTVTVYCGDLSDTLVIEVIDKNTEPEIIPCESISLNKTTMSLELGQNETLIATKTPSNTTDYITWESSNMSIATVNNGVVTSKAEGSCKITATCGSKTSTCTVTVNNNSSSGDSGVDETCTRLEFIQDSLTLAVGNQELIQDILICEPASMYPYITWKYSTNISVDLDSGIVGLETGEVTLIAYCGDLSDTIDITVV